MCALAVAQLSRRSGAFRWPIRLDQPPSRLRSLARSAVRSFWAGMTTPMISSTASQPDHLERLSDAGPIALGCQVTRNSAESLYTPPGMVGHTSSLDPMTRPSPHSGDFDPVLFRGALSSGVPTGDAPSHSYPQHQHRTVSHNHRSRLKGPELPGITDSPTAPAIPALSNPPTFEWRSRAMRVLRSGRT